MNRAYGWVKDKQDHRDLKCKLSGKSDFPPMVDLRNEFKFPDVYDQGHLGSCTAQAIGFVYQYDEIFQHNTCCFMPSRLFIYYNERSLEGTINEDSGASIRDGIKTINSIGVCEEKLHPYEIEKFTTRPSKVCYDEAAKCKALEYSRVDQDLNSIKEILNSKRPIVFGFRVYESFESHEVAKSGIMPQPNVKKERLLGGHAVVCVGYDDEKKTFIIRNSWGAGWGDNGYFHMPYSVLCDTEMSADLWVVKKVSDPVLKSWNYCCIC